MIDKFLYIVTLRCEECGTTQERGYNKVPRPSNYFEGGRRVVISMICKGTCRRPPDTEAEREAVRIRASGQGGDGYITRPSDGYAIFVGPPDGLVPETRPHLLTGFIKNEAVSQERRKNRSR